MPNIFDENGLQIETRDETYAGLVAIYQSIYGPEINLDPSTPDRNFLEAITQVITDLLELLLSVNTAFDPDSAVGVTLDQRVAINGIERQEGSYSTTDVTVFSSRSVTLYGLDQSSETVFTVSDNEGNRWFLINTIEGLNSGLGTPLAFRAEFPGQVTTTPNTITNMDTVVLGVTQVNNPTAALTVGSTEESDGKLKIRRRQSVSMGGRGWLSSMIAALRNLSGMISANVFENKTSAIVNGVPAHGIWAMTEGSVSDEDIAETIFIYRTGGLDMRGDKSYAVDRPGASTTVISWDEVAAQSLFVYFTPAYVEFFPQFPDTDEIKAFIVGALFYQPGEPAALTSVGRALEDYNPDIAFKNASASWTPYIGLSTGQYQSLSTIGGIPNAGTFKLKYGPYETAAIAYNATDTNIRDAIRALPGLGAATVSSSQNLVPEWVINVSLNASEGVLALLVPTAVSLTYSASPVRLKNAPRPDYAPNSVPAQVVPTQSFRHKFSLIAENIITGLFLYPYARLLVGDGQGPYPDADTTIGEQITFSAKGGLAPYTYIIATNNSGGTINATTGVYTAGGVGNVIDFIKVRDALGNESVSTSVNVGV